MPVLIPPAGEIFIRTMFLTMRTRAYGLWEPLEILSSGKGIILTFWHGRMLMLPGFFEKWLKHEAYVLISRHGDGELISRAIKRFNADSIRGSSTRGGREAMEEMVRMTNRGVIIAITPDGPRGPMEKARPGAIELAQRTGAPIFPLSYAASRQKRMNSWDRFLVPAPFSNVAFVLGKPIRVKNDESKEGLEQMRQLLERKITEVGDEAERLALSRR